MPIGGAATGMAIKAAMGAAANSAEGMVSGDGGGGGLGGILKGIGGKAKGAIGGMSGAETIGAVLGIGQKIKAGRLKKKAEAAMPQEEDPEMRKALTYVQRRKRAFQTGTAMQGERRSMERSLAGGQAKAMKFGAGGRAGLNVMRDMFQQSLGQLQQTTGLKGELAFGTQAIDLTKEIGQRKIDLAMNRSDRMFAEAATLKDTADQNLGALIGRKAGVGKVASAVNTGTTATTEQNQEETTV